MQSFTIKLVHQWLAFIGLAKVPNQHWKNHKETVARPAPHAFFQYLEPFLRGTILKSFVEEDFQEGLGFSRGKASSDKLLAVEFAESWHR